MNNYNLGIMWSIGTLSKGINRYSVQTYDNSKLQYVDILAKSHNKEVKRVKRTSRGKTKELYILNFNDADMALRLRSMGYDDPDVEIPNDIDDSFLAAMLELRLSKYRNNGVIAYRINSKHCEAWSRILTDRFGISEKKVCQITVECISIGKTEMLSIAEQVLKFPECNKSFWNDVVDSCKTKKSTGDY